MKEFEEVINQRPAVPPRGVATRPMVPRNFEFDSYGRTVSPMGHDRERWVNV